MKMISVPCLAKGKCNPPQERNDLRASAEHLLPASNVSDITCLNAGSPEIFSISRPENSLTPLLDVDILNSFLNADLDSSSSNSLTSLEVPSQDVTNLFNEGLNVHSGGQILMSHEMDCLGDLSDLASWLSYNDSNFEAQSDLVVTDGINHHLQNLRINIPESSQRPNKGKENKDIKSVLLKDLNVLHNYICALIIDQAGKSTDDNQRCQKLDAIQKLLELSPSVVNKQNKIKETLLHVSTQQNNADALEILLKCGGNPNLRNNNGDNCLHIAARNNSLKCLKILCSSFSRNFLPGLNALNYEGLAPLHVALENESEECIALLLHYGANINVEEAKSGRTILHLAVDSCPSLVPFILKQSGISVNAMDFSGKTSLDIANHNELHDVESQLLIAGAGDEHENKRGSLNENVTDKLSEFSLPLTNVSETSMVNDIQEEKIIYNIKDESQFLPPSVVKKICELIDPPDERWRILGFTMGLDESYLNTVEKLDSHSSPTLTLLNYFQRKFGNNSRIDLLQELQSMLEVIGIKDDVLLS